MSFKDKLKLLREEKGISQETLAKKLGFTTGMAVSNWEKGRSEPSLEVLWKLSRELECSVDYLLSSEKDNNYESIMLKDKIYDMCESFDEDTIQLLYNFAKILETRVHEKSLSESLPEKYIQNDDKLYHFKNDPEYLEMKNKTLGLKPLKKKACISSWSLAEQLRYCGYNGQISVADIELIFCGKKVPTEKLYNTILKIINIRVEMYSKYKN